MREPGADAVHDAGGLSVSRPLPPGDAAALAARLPRHRRRVGASGMMRRVLWLLPLRRCPACMVGPDYQKPDAPVSARLQGTAGLDRRAAAGRGGTRRLVVDLSRSGTRRAGTQVDVSNQTVKQFEAQYRNAVALVQEAQAEPVSHRRAQRRRDAQFRLQRQRHGSSAATLASHPPSSGLSGGSSGGAAHAIQPRGQRSTGTSTSGAAFAGRSRARSPARRSARPIWRMPSCRRRRRWPPTISICAPRIR